MEAAWTAVIGAVAAALVLVATKLYPLALSWRQSVAEDKVKSRKDAKADSVYILRQYKGLIDNLKQDLDEVRAEIKTLQAANIQCHTDNAMLSAASKALQKEVNGLKEQVVELQQRQVS